MVLENQFAIYSLVVLLGLLVKMGGMLRLAIAMFMRNYQFWILR
jgi:hypothetical protein